MKECVAVQQQEQWGRQRWGPVWPQNTQRGLPVPCQLSGQVKHTQTQPSISIQRKLHLEKLGGLGQKHTDNHRVLFINRYTPCVKVHFKNYCTIIVCIFGFISTTLPALLSLFSSRKLEWVSRALNKNISLDPNSHLSILWVHLDGLAGILLGLLPLLHAQEDVCSVWDIRNLKIMKSWKLGTYLTGCIILCNM